MNPKLPVGIENFEEIRKEGFYYVDKSYLIRDLLNSWGKVNLFTRPRRFGKTLNMSMLKSFFELDADKTLFDGLAIMQETELCEKYMGKFPVVFISLKNVEGENYHHALDCLKIIIQQEAIRLFDQIGESVLLEYEKPSLIRLMDGTASTAELQDSLKLFSRVLFRYFGQKTILLIDAVSYTHLTLPTNNRV